MARGPVVVLAGGTGGAKLARGMFDLVGERLTVVANTADDITIYGARVCPDPDLILFHLCDRIDDRGWGLDGDSFNAMDQLAELGAETWFRLGDRDLAIGIDRARRLSQGERLTEATAALAESLGVSARVLPMCDEPVETVITAGGKLRPFQQFMIVDGAKGPIESVSFNGIESARITPEVQRALSDAEAIVIGPSNPSISIGPILRVPGMQEAIKASTAPVIAVSPLVKGAAVKGPTEEFLAWEGVELSADGIANHYASIADGLIADSEASSMTTLVTDLLMDGPDGRRRLAQETLSFADQLRHE